MAKYFITMDNSENKNCSILTLDEAYDRFENNRKARNLSADTIKEYYKGYTYFCNFLDYLKNNFGVEITRCDQVYSEITEDYILYMKQERSIKDTTINTYVISIRTFLNFCFEKGYIPRFKISLMKVQGTIKELYTDKEIETLLQKPDMEMTKFTEYRNWLAEVFFYDTGVRIKTLVNIQIQDILFDRNKIAIRVQKNKRVTYIHLSPLLKEYIQEYLTYRKRKT